jgi:hypothetical protein
MHGTHGIILRPRTLSAGECFTGRRVYHNLLARSEPFLPQRPLAQRLMQNRNKPNNFPPPRAPSERFRNSKPRNQFRRLPPRPFLPPSKCCHKVNRGNSRGPMIEKGQTPTSRSSRLTPQHPTNVGVTALRLNGCLGHSSTLHCRPVRKALWQRGL